MYKMSTHTEHITVQVQCVVESDATPLTEEKAQEIAAEKIQKCLETGGDFTRHYPQAVALMVVTVK